MTSAQMMAPEDVVMQCFQCPCHCRHMKASDLPQL